MVYYGVERFEEGIVENGEEERLKIVLVVYSVKVQKGVVIIGIVDVQNITRVDGGLNLLVHSVYFLGKHNTQLITCLCQVHRFQLFDQRNHEFPVHKHHHLYLTLHLNALIITVQVALAIVGINHISVIEQ